ncbi:MAG TPA: NADH-quinone oxidoreductase subunit NuoK [Candidatus Limnocylindrales bacterium]|jgi:NADH-quinone oxidoreductase subunit K|nr:NADH-quinone oxidoreductase subunit NuoK [Candidatus Limnocylindrales bacterium]
MSPVPLSYYLVVSTVIFFIGMLGVLTRRNVIIILMSIELMLNAANINFITFSYYLNSLRGQIFVFFVMTVAAAEAAVGLAVIVYLFRNKNTVNDDEFSLMRW